MNPGSLFTALLLLILLPSSARTQTFLPDQTPHPWTNKPFPNRDSAFQFAIISDLTGGYRQHGIFQSAVEKIKLLSPEFVMSVGDIIEGYTDDTAQVHRWWNQFDGWVDKLECPFFYVPGNHDLTNAAMTRIWEQRYGRSYYHFIYRNVLFLVVNTEDGFPAERQEFGNISAEQVAYFKQVLADHPEVDWTLLFMHRPMWYAKEPGFGPMDEILKNRPYTVFAGHAHVYLKEERFGRDYYTLSTTGGGSSLLGPNFGAFDEVAWITMSARGPRVANIALDGILPNDLRVKETELYTENFQNLRLQHTEPWYSTPTGQKQRTTELVLHNTTEAPLRFTGQFLQHPEMQLSPWRTDTIVAPGQSLKIFVKSVEHGIPTEQNQQPAVFQWSMDASFADRNFHRSGSYPLPILPILKLDPLPIDFKLDGQWREWTGDRRTLPNHVDYFPETFHGASDLSFDVRTARSRDQLILALRVYDDSLLYSPYRASWEQEGAELELRLPNYPYPLQISFSATADAAQPMIDVQKNWPPNAEVRAIRLADGFSAEIALPLDALKTLNKSVFSEFFLQWILYDHDGLEDQYKGTKAFWQPETLGAGRVRW